MSKTTWKCNVCGYIHEGESPPDVCPVCGVGSDQFSRVELASYQPPTARTWKCNVCGYIHEGDNPPDTCPVCSVPAEHFSPLEVTDQRASSTARRIVIVGAGVAGMTAAQTAAQKEGTQVTVISKEAGLPYYRLNLTRYLSGEVSPQDLVMYDQEWFSRYNVTLLDDEVVCIHRDRRQVSLKGGDSVSYDKLIIANGAHPFVPPIVGNTRQGVYTLRTIADADAIIARAKTGPSCAIIGGGLLGLETAGALSARGCAVTVLENHPWILPRQLPSAAANRLVEILRKKDISVETEAQTREIFGDEEASGVQIDTDKRIDASLVVVSTGIRPNSYLARKCGIDVHHGVVVNEFMQTSDSDIYAAGDVAEHLGILYGIWPTAYLQGKVAAENACGGQLRFDEVPPSNRLKVLDVDLFSVGVVNPPDGSYRVFEQTEGDHYYYLTSRDGLVTGAVLLGDTGMAADIQDVIEKQIPVKKVPQLMQRFTALG